MSRLRGSTRNATSTSALLKMRCIARVIASETSTPSAAPAAAAMRLYAMPSAMNASIRWPRLHPDGAAHAHLRPPFRREHQQDEEDQEHTGGDGEQAQHDEDRCQVGARLLRAFDPVLLQGHDLQPRRRTESIACLRDVVGVRERVSHAALVRDRGEARDLLAASAACGQPEEERRLVQVDDEAFRLLERPAGEIAVL